MQPTYAEEPRASDGVAEELSIHPEDFAYVNLAVRGLLLPQILDEQIAPALALKPDLITLNGRGNDLIFRNRDPDKLAVRLDEGVELLASTGATVVLFTGPDWGATPLLGRPAGRWLSSMKTPVLSRPATMLSSLIFGRCENSRSL